MLLAITRSAALAALLGLWSAADATKQPHLVFFLVDDYGFADVGYHSDMYGTDPDPCNSAVTSWKAPCNMSGGAKNMRMETPNLDRLSAAGIRLENYYIQPVCSPTRATLLTGRYVFHHGVHVPFIDSSRSTLPLNETTLAERLQSAGYRTHMIGKWHLGFRTPAHAPNERGFESFYGYYAGSQDYFNHQSLCWSGKVENGCFENTTSLGEPVTGLDLHNGTEVTNSSEYSTTLYTTEADRIVAAHAAEHGVGAASATGGRVLMTKPLFLYLPHQAVHVGNLAEESHPEYARDQAPSEYIERFQHIEDEQRRNLSAMVYAMDEAAGNVTESLKQHGLWQDTIFIVSTDNGGPTGERASNYPLNGAKGSLWQGGVRGMGFVAGGDLASFGFRGFPRVSHSLTHVSDWNPTLCEFAGGCPLASKLPLDGVSAWGALTAGKGSRPEDSESNRTDIYHDICLAWMGGSCLERLDQEGGPFKEGAIFASMMRGNWKLMIGQKKNNYTAELFSLKDDVGEHNDLAASNPAKVQELFGAIMEMSKTAGMAHDRDPIDPKSNPNLHGGSWVPWDNI